MPELLIMGAAIGTSTILLLLLTRRHRRTQTIRGMLTGEPPCAQRR